MQEPPKSGKGDKDPIPGGWGLDQVLFLIIAIAAGILEGCRKFWQWITKPFRSKPK